MDIGFRLNQGSKFGLEANEKEGMRLEQRIHKRYAANF
jgi:hypothetical protein